MKKSSLYYTSKRRIKRFKLKNLRKINGKPLIYYPIKAAIESKVCDKIFVSTDSKKIAKVAKILGRMFPF